MVLVYWGIFSGVEFYRRKCRSLDDEFLQCLLTKKIYIWSKSKCGTSLTSILFTWYPLAYLPGNIPPPVALEKDTTKKVSSGPSWLTWKYIFQHRTVGLENWYGRRCTLELIECFSSKPFNPSQTIHPPPHIVILLLLGYLLGNIRKWQTNRRVRGLKNGRLQTPLRREGYHRICWVRGQWNN